ncbi:MAG: nucleotide sugar dehydrogenase [Myxococcales bacterium]|nr:MAG: nucleotide sugar dehydrogenase [Myxococcales bacterium]
MYKALWQRIEEKTATVGVIGLGYVGLPLVLEFNRAGFHVLGFDLDPKKVEKLGRGETYIRHISNEKLQALAAGGRFEATSDFKRLREPDALIICVPTPLNVNREPDLSFVEGTARQIAARLRKGQLVSLESTTYPGTTDELVLPILENASGLKVGRDFFLAFSPEREDPGNPKYSTRTIPKVVGGMTKHCGDLAEALYAAIVTRVVRVSGLREAEMTKLLENIFRAVNIALVNELKIVCEHMHIDLWEVIDAASTKPFGYMPFYPGPGLGGHCIPIDPFYLTWKAREYKVSTRFIELAGEINTAMPEYVVTKVLEAMNERQRALKGAKILVLGVAYKKDVDDMRESPALELIELLRDKGARVDYHDPYIPKLPPTRKYKFDMKSKPLTAKTLASADVVLIATDHTAFDYEFIAEHAPLVIDTRNAAKRVKKHRAKIRRA